jgi:acetolactate synthase-1/2/3 large subunit
MGPVLLDVPMDIQKESVTPEQKILALQLLPKESIQSEKINLAEILGRAKRPVVVIGAGAGLAGTSREIQAWCESHDIPYVTSWGAISYINRSAAHYFGSLGVYGSRVANWLIQSADEVIVFGSRLDNRQRTGNPKGFAPYAQITILDVDYEELRKFQNQSNYLIKHFNLADITAFLVESKKHTQWVLAARSITSEMQSGFDHSVKLGELNPYQAVRVAQSKFEKNAIVVSDCGANLCWVYQSYLPDSTFLFTSGGNSPMGYSLPAAIGAQLMNPSKKVYCFIGDGGLQMNIQELQTIIAYKLPIVIFIQNNYGYGIIKQFQDANFKGRHFASGEGYTLPSFQRIAEAYGIPYFAIKSIEELKNLTIPNSATLIDLQLPPDALITPKTEGDNFIHNQFPYIGDSSIQKLHFSYPERPSEL